MRNSGGSTSECQSDVRALMCMKTSTICGNNVKLPQVFPMHSAVGHVTPRLLITQDKLKM